MSFDSLGLMPELTRAITERGYTVPTPVQAQAIPEILKGNDVLAGAQTGTGKTAGFTLPILQRLHAGGSRKSPRALILVPTRELAAQVADNIRAYGKYLNLRTIVVFGGVNINPQTDALLRGVDILVATPGRLLDHISQGNVELDFIETFVLDEADRMLDMGFIHDIKRVRKMLPPKRQNLMFSATYSEDIRGLAQSLLRNPVEIEVARRNTAVEAVTQYAHLVSKDSKRALLSHLIRTQDWTQVLVFTRTKHGANRLCKQLQEDGIAAAAIHGNKSQNARTQALAGFKVGKVRALVATEVAARGLDIKELPYVVNYELPNVPEDYVHRIGRTGRAGALGIAVSLVASDESGLLRDIERTIGRSITREALPQISAAPKNVSLVVEDDGDRQGGSRSDQQRNRQPQSRNGHGHQRRGQSNSNQAHSNQPGSHQSNSNQAGSNQGTRGASGGNNGGRDGANGNRGGYNQGSQNQSGRNSQDRNHSSRSPSNSGSSQGRSGQGHSGHANSSYGNASYGNSSQGNSSQGNSNHGNSNQPHAEQNVGGRAQFRGRSA